jgi:hypothetical protein
MATHALEPEAAFEPAIAASARAATIYSSLLTDVGGAPATTRRRCSSPSAP